MTGELVLSLRGLAARYGRREVFHGVTVDVRGGQALGVIGPSGAGKTTLLRAMVGLVHPSAGDVRLGGLRPQHATGRTPIAYFGGEGTVPGGVRARAWSALEGEPTSTERRRVRTLARGARQWLGLRTVLARPGIGLLVLDEPWEGLDVDGARWLSAVAEGRRDRGAILVVSSHRLQDLPGLCDAYLFLAGHRALVLRAQDMAPAGLVTEACLVETLDRVRAGASQPERVS